MVPIPKTGGKVMPPLARLRHVIAMAVAAALLAGCNDQARTGSGTGGAGAGAAADAPGVSSPIGGTTGTRATGTTVGPGSGTTNASKAN
jgi:hypothetical protein